MRKLIEYFGYGTVYKELEAFFFFFIRKFYDINHKIISFFQKYSILEVKSKDFDDFCKIAEMIKEGKHLTSHVLEKIRQIKVRVNTRRQR